MTDEVSPAVLAVIKRTIEEQDQRFQQIASAAVDNALDRHNHVNIRDDLKRKRELEDVDFKKKGNKKMFQHNIKVLDTVENAIASANDENFENTISHLKQGKTLLEKRIKIIKLADREDWLTVAEYLSDDLADDSADEKKF